MICVNRSFGICGSAVVETLLLRVIHMDVVYAETAGAFFGPARVAYLNSETVLELQRHSRHPWLP